MEHTIVKDINNEDILLPKEEGVYTVISAAIVEEYVDIQRHLRYFPEDEEGIDNDGLRIVVFHDGARKAIKGYVRPDGTVEYYSIERI